MTSALQAFSKPTRMWFENAFELPTPAQEHAWDAVREGKHTLVVAPTGSGKTLAAFLWALDKLATEPTPQDVKRRTRVVYISPLKALAVDIERNLRAPLTGIRAAATQLDQAPYDISVGVRSGDTPAIERQRFLRAPTDILITTPESLYLMVTSRAREVLLGVETVIIDEVHAVAGTKRGAHLALTLERLDSLLQRPAQRIGLSATVRPVSTVARFLGGAADVRVVQPAQTKQIDLEVVVPVEDLSAIGELTGEIDGSAAGGERRTSVWPHVESRIVDLVAAHRSTIVFANSRRLAERLSARLNEEWYERNTDDELPTSGEQAPFQVMAQAGSTRGHDPSHELARAHHGSVSREQRQHIEEELKQGLLPAVVATSSLELGIDMGAVDLVIQVESPPSVASGLQRVGRAEHRVDGVSRGVLFPKHRGDLIPTAVIVDRMRSGQIEELSIPRNPLDVLAQHIVAMTSMDRWSVTELAALVRRAAPFSTLPQSAFDAVLDMLAGRYPSDAFAELRPRLIWDRDADEVTARPGAHRLAVINGGTIPDRGLYGVFLIGGDAAVRGPGRRVGELDEEMVYESRIGDVFALGATSWRIEDITHDQVLVSPAPGLPGKLPFWHGDTIGRPAELGRAIGAFTRELLATTNEQALLTVGAAGLDRWASENLVAYLREQEEACGHVADDRTIVIERFRDEIGDWRVVIHSPFGGRVNTPWALAIASGVRDDLGIDVQVMPSDDGIVLRLPDIQASDDEPPSLLGHLVIAADDVERAVTSAVSGSALFASRFRECAARALLLPRRRPDRRVPLWQQRQRAAQLLAVASEHAQFPIVLETMRECLQDVFDVPALRSLMDDLAVGNVRIVEVETSRPSPFARSLLFSYVGAFLYEGDAPLAERRAQALALDSTLLAELMGQAELRELLDVGAIEQVEQELQRLHPDRAFRQAEDVADALREIGPLSTDAAKARGADPAWLDTLAAARRIVTVRISGQPLWAAVEDLGRLRDGVGVAPPMGVPAAFLEPVPDPVGDLVSRYARTHGPFTVADAADTLSLGPAVVESALQRFVSVGRVVSGEFRPGGSGTEWCDAEVLRAIRRRSLAILRKEAEPVPARALARFLPDWQGVRRRVRGAEGLYAVIEQLQGSLAPASAWESHILPARVADYTSAMLDELTSTGAVVWAGSGTLGSNDGWLSFATTDQARLLLPLPNDQLSPAQQQVLQELDMGVALFFRALSDRVRSTDDAALSDTIWSLVWSGHLTNDTMSPLRARMSAHRTARGGPPRQQVRPRYVRSGRAVLPSRMGAADVAGRWSGLPLPEVDPTVRAAAFGRVLLERYGIVTRGSVVTERRPGGFAASYRVLAAMEEAGQARRGYFVEGLGAAQFGAAGAADQLRQPSRQSVPVIDVLAATDPANSYGAALPWPPREPPNRHQPGRKAGAVVVLVDGELALYVERGGKSLLSWLDDDRLQPAVEGLTSAVRRGLLGRLSIERADGNAVFDSPLASALQAAGFRLTPRGLRLSPERQ